MAARLLTDRFCEGVKPARSGQAAYHDAKITGLEFRVSAEGRKVWSLRYRINDGRQRRMTLGAFPVMVLAQARAEAMATLARVAKGDDPAAEKRRDGLRARAEPIKTFGDLIGAYFVASEAGKWKPKGRAKRQSTLADERRNYRVHIEPTWKTTAIEDLDRSAVRGLLRAMEAKGLGARINRTQALIRQVFAYAVAEERLAVNPAIGVQQLAEEKARERTLSDRELASLWAATVDPSALRLPSASDGPGARVHVARPMAIILQLAALLLQRRSELAGMRTSELDLAQGTWLIPADRMKSARPHMVPLPPKALALIREAIQLKQKRETKDRRTDCVFPGQRTLANPIRGDSVTHTFSKIAKGIGLEGASVHDVRRTGATAMTSERLRVSPFIRSLVLGHADAGGGAVVSSAHYDRNTYLPEKRAAMAAWEGLLLEIVGERTPADNVTRLRSASIA